MCTLIVLHRPDDPWPLLVAGNRDERRGRPWTAPGRHWPDRPGVVAGRDELAGGSWFGINDRGLVAVVMDRAGALGPQAGRRSRGELVLDALAHADVHAAARALAARPADAYRPFNLFIGSAAGAYWLANRAGAGHLALAAIAPGLHMLAAGELDDPAIARIRHNLPVFRSAPAPDVARGDWAAWQALLASRAVPPGQAPAAAMNVVLDGGLETLCSQCVALPARRGALPVFLFAGGPPDRAAFTPVDCRPPAPASA